MELTKKQPTMKHSITINGVHFFIQYLGKQVEGQCKWHITSTDITDLDQDIDTLWYTKQEAIEAIQDYIS